MVGVKRLAVAAAVLTALCLPALADIRSFNAAMEKRDYKAAASAAASAWPGLDKSRADIAIIAREFGFAAYVAGDFAAARTYGEAAYRGSVAAGEAPDLQASSEVLLRLAAYRLDSSDGTRDQLYAALERRSAQGGLDLVSYLGADAVVTHDFAREYWKSAVSSAALGEKLTLAGGAAYLARANEFALLNTVAAYMDEPRMASIRDLSILRSKILVAINLAASDAGAADLVSVYWDLMAWRDTMRLHMQARGDYKVSDESGSAMLSGRALRLLGAVVPPNGCPSLELKEKPNIYPQSAQGQGLVASVIARFDIGADGRIQKAELLAAVPAKHFGDAVLSAQDRYQFGPGKGSPAGCSLARTGMIFTFNFRVTR
jgi:TonB family protein